MTNTNSTWGKIQITV